jgi:DNA-binding transcriptional MerR regulator
MRDIKEMWASNAPRSGDNPEIPDKLYFRIGEVSRVSGVKPHVLRYWETEFPAITPKKSGSGHRLYRRKDVELILEIKRLLYEERFTIEGARKYLGQKARRQAARAGKPPAQGELFEAPAEGANLDEIRQELREILEMLSRPVSG